jgi:hypothetical protein
MLILRNHFVSGDRFPVLKAMAMLCHATALKTGDILYFSPGWFSNIQAMRQCYKMPLYTV